MRLRSDARRGVVSSSRATERNVFIPRTRGAVREVQKQRHVHIEKDFTVRTREYLVSDDAATGPEPLGKYNAVLRSAATIYHVGDGGGVRGARNKIVTASACTTASPASFAAVLINTHDVARTCGRATRKTTTARCATRIITDCTQRNNTTL